MKIGILGGGQLARMLAQAATSIGYQTLCIDPNPVASAKAVTQVIHAELTDKQALSQLAKDVDVITFETENIPQTTIDFIATKIPLSPDPNALKICQDRFLEKNFCNKLNIPTADFWKVDSFNDLLEAIEQCGYPALLKTRRFGYDGKGQFKITAPDELHTVWQDCQQKDLILEHWVDYRKELSCLGVCTNQQKFATYPIIENHHINGILHTSTVANDCSPLIRQLAEQYTQKIMEKFNYCGVLAVEFFQLNNEKLIVNEIAPRVHNSGHWTIEGASCSQFENHIRAVTNLPIGSCAAIGYTTMINAIGTLPSLQEMLAIRDCHWHAYGKAARPKRKLGHATIHSENFENLQNSLSKALLIKPFDRGC